MKVTIIKGPHMEENIQKCYHIIAKHIRKKIMQGALKAGKTIDEYLEEILKEER